MTVGLIDVDAESRGKVTFPNLPLMKLSAWHKAQGDEVGWYDKTGATHYDRVYLARVFGDEYTHEYEGPINADEVIRGGVRVCDSCGAGKRALLQSRRP